MTGDLDLSAHRREDEDSHCGPESSPPPDDRNSITPFLETAVDSSRLRDSTSNEVSEDARRVSRAEVPGPMEHHVGNTEVEPFDPAQKEECDSGPSEEQTAKRDVQQGGGRQGLCGHDETGDNGVPGRGVVEQQRYLH